MYTLNPEPDALINSGATVLITGATGFVGRALLHQVSSRGCQIRILAREGSLATTLATNYGAELIHGDILSKSAVEKSMENVTHVFHLAARGQSRAPRGHSAASESDLTRRVNVEGTKLIAESAVQAPKPPRFVHFSTVGVHGDVQDGPGDETSPFNATTDYELTKLEAELWLKNFAADENLPLTILRPSAIVGPGDHRLLKLFRLGSRRLTVIAGSGANRYQLIHVDDCASALMAAAQRSQAVGETYICGNAETLTIAEIINQIYSSNQHHQNRRNKQKIIKLPIQPIRQLLKATDKLYGLAGKVSPIAESRLSFFEHNHWFDTKHLSEHLAVTSRAGVALGVSERETR